MPSTQAIFTLFYAIFWGALSNVQPRWRMFDYPRIHHKRICRRVGISFLFFNVLPIAYFIFVLYFLREADFKAPFTFSSITREVLAGVLPAFGVFGFYRLWISVIEWNPDKYYWRHSAPREFGRLESPMEELGLVPADAGNGHMWQSNCVVGILYLLVPLGISWLAIHVCICD